MKFSDISHIRLSNQHVAGTKFTSASEVVDWMGAMQAQDFNQAKWAIGVRLPDATEKMVNEALDAGEIIRTHLMRPTWHLVTAADIHWLVPLTAARIIASMKTRDKQLGLTEAIYTKTNSIIVKALEGDNHLTRDELVGEFHKAQIDTNENRMSHIMFRAELEGIACSGRSQGNKQTYALLPERVPKTTTLVRDEALALLARKYFASHGPATLADFIWWSGLLVADARHALEMVKTRFISETIGDQTYWFTNPSAAKPVHAGSVHLLPAFDEFIISYKDRTASLPADHHARAVSNNGIFWPIIVVDGQVTGVWKRSFCKNTVMLETKFFRTPEDATQQQVEKAFARYGWFVGKQC
jgi:hypothetical protein